MLIDVVQSAQHEDRLPHSLDLVVRHVRYARTDVPRRGMRTNKHFHAVGEVKRLKRDLRNVVPVVRNRNDQSRRHAELNGYIIHPIAYADGVNHVVVIVPLVEPCQQAVFNKQFANRQRELRAQLYTESVGVGCSEPQIRLHLKVLVDRHESADVKTCVRAVGGVVQVADVQPHGILIRAKLHLCHGRQQPCKQQKQCCKFFHILFSLYSFSETVYSSTIVIPAPPRSGSPSW